MRTVLVTSANCLAKYGRPELEKAMTLFDVPSYLEIGVIPKRLYCNKDLVLPLTQAFEALVRSDRVYELRTFDGCFNIRPKRGSRTMSLHSWGIAIDVNASWNKRGTKGNLSKEFVACFKDNGFHWGGDWSGADCDPMHFQLASI